MHPFDLTSLCLFKKYTIRVCQVPQATPLHFFLAVCAQSAQHSLFSICTFKYFLVSGSN